MDAKQINVELGRLWKELAAEDKQEYTDLAKEDKARYEAEMKDYVRPSEEELEKLNAGKRGGTQTKVDPNQPKKVKSAFTFFCEAMRQQVKEENPDMDATPSGPAAQ
eukprot:GFYU01027968.1.p2 GENE.GFYU01027968.1~~GFYU01027968.1.p2  ORF type:complete len:107 (-),score=50.51 GFYU01027968.1:139-459(-)